MKRFLFAVILSLVVLMRMPLADWERMDDKARFVNSAGRAFNEVYRCSDSIISVIKFQGDAVVIGECLDKEQSKEKDVQKEIML